LDLLAFYLETGFCIDNVRRADIDGLVIGGASKPIDNYYNCLDAGEPAQKPRLGLPALWRSTLNAEWAKGFQGWTRATHALHEAQLRAANGQTERVIRGFEHSRVTYMECSPRRRRRILHKPPRTSDDAPAKSPLGPAISASSMASSPASIALIAKLIRPRAARAPPRLKPQRSPRSRAARLRRRGRK
jgi:hypothetical protein